MEQERKNGPDSKDAFNLVVSMLIVFQRAMTVPIRNRYGINALGMPCLMAVGLMLVWGGFSRDLVMFAYLGLWSICFIVRRIESVRLAAAGEKIHSDYDGWPWDAVRIAGNERAAKMFVEPLLVFILGAIVYWIYLQLELPVHGMPYFLFTCGLSMMFVEMMRYTMSKQRTQAMLDARLEQEEMMYNFRQKHGDY